MRHVIDSPQSPHRVIPKKLVRDPKKFVYPLLRNGRKNEVTGQIFTTQQL